MGRKFKRIGEGLNAHPTIFNLIKKEQIQSFSGITAFAFILHWFIGSGWALVIWFWLCVTWMSVAKDKPWKVTNQAKPTPRWQCKFRTVSSLFQHWGRR